MEKILAEFGIVTDDDVKAAAQKIKEANPFGSPPFTAEVRAAIFARLVEIEAA